MLSELQSGDSSAQEWALKVMQDIDVDDHGNLTLASWLQYWGSARAGTVDTVVDLQLRRIKAKCARLNRTNRRAVGRQRTTEMDGLAKEVFVMLDTEGTGLLDMSEVRGIVVNDAASRWVQEIDLGSGGGQVSMDEWKTYWGSDGSTQQATLNKLTELKKAIANVRLWRV